MWHAKHQLKRPKTSKKGEKRKRPTKDEGVWDAPLDKSRRCITIQEKLKVIEFREKLLAEHHAANKAICEPVQLNQTSADKKAAQKAKKKAKETLKKRVQNECSQKFPDIVGCCRVAKWAKTAAKEHWKDLPDAYASRASATNNAWRMKVGAPLKGRTEGGGVPLVLQKELDVLLMEMTAGASEVSERKEVVTTEQVAIWRCFVIVFFGQLTCPRGSKDTFLLEHTHSH